MNRGGPGGLGSRFEPPRPKEKRSGRAHRAKSRTVVLAVLDDLDEDLRVDHRERHRRVEAGVVDHVLDGDRAARDVLLDLEDLLLLRLELHGSRLCEGGRRRVG